MNLQTATGEPLTLIIDFDSTFTRVEALDELARIALAEHPDRDAVVGRIQALTDRGMSGELPVDESLRQRLQLLRAHRQHLPALIDVLQQQVTESVKRNLDFFQFYSQDIYIVSNGFAEFIVPVVAPYGLSASQVLANRFTFDAQDNITGLDTTLPLSRAGGKVQAVAGLGLTTEKWVIGDGYTDYEIKAAGQARQFIAFTENVARQNVLEVADWQANSFDEIIEKIKK